MKFTLDTDFFQYEGATTARTVEKVISLSRRGTTYDRVTQLFYCCANGAFPKVYYPPPPPAPPPSPRANAPRYYTNTEEV